MWETIKTPAYVVDEKKLRENLECLHRVEEETGCHILLAQKAFSMFRVYPLIGSYLSGTTASGLYEARLGSVSYTHLLNWMTCFFYKKRNRLHHL